MPAASTRATGERDSSPSFQASVHSPLAARARMISWSRLRPRRHHVQARSMITASARPEQAASGIMTGPPRASTTISPLTALLPAHDPTDRACLLRCLLDDDVHGPGSLAGLFGGWLARAVEAANGLAISSGSACPTS